MSELNPRVVLLLKVSTTLLAAWLLFFLFAGRNPRWQVWAFRGAAVGVVLLVCLSIAPPVFEYQVVEEVPQKQTSDESEATVAVNSTASSDATSETLSDPLSRELQAEFVPDSNRASVGPEPLDSSAESETKPSVVPTAPVIASETSTAAVVATADLGWTWTTMLAGIWLLGVLIGTLRLVLGLLGIHRIVKRSVSVDSEVRQPAIPLADQLGVSLPRIGVTPSIGSPSVVGVLRPTVLLPPSLLISGRENDLRSALAHEFCHIAGRDLLWDFAIRCLSILGWLHPLLWKFASAHRNACESVSDVVAADTVDDRQSYAASVARIASGLAEQPECGLAMARTSNVVRRLRHLAGGLKAHALGRCGRMATVFGLLAVLLVGSSAIVKVQLAVADEQVAQQTEEPRTLRFKVLHAKTGESLAGAFVEFRYRHKELVRIKVQTDQAGIAEFVYPVDQGDAYLRITTRKSGFVPYYSSFDRQPSELLPTEKTVRIDPGKKVAGRIVDSDGKPVKGAEVSIRVPTVDPPRQNHVYSLLYTVTGEDGKWELDAASEPVSGLTLQVEHQRYKNGSFSVRDSLDQSYTLDRGWTVRGVVNDGNGKPISGAKVLPGYSRFGSSQPETLTDDQGRYELSGLDKDRTLMTALADRYAPQLDEVEPGESSLANLDLTLQLGKEVSFRFVDPDGKPIEGVWVAADTWRGHRTVDWRSNSGADGVVRWNGAPSEPVTYDAGHKDFRASRNMSLLPRDEPHQIVLLPNYVATGSVVDAATGEPIPEFEAQFGWLNSRSEISWSSSDTIVGRNGKFSLSYDEVEPKLYLRVSAKGYKPWVSSEIDLSKPAEPLKIEVELRSGVGPTGIVMSPNGQPAKGAVVALGLKGRTLQYQRGYRPYHPVQRVTTSETGQFQLEFVPEDEPGIVAFIHDSGYAERSLQELRDDPKVKLEEWASLTVKVVEEGKPVAGRSVKFQPRRKRSRVVDVFSYGIEAETDENGIVVLDRVLPSSGIIAMILVQQHRDGSTHYPSAARNITLSPGENRMVQLGGNGRTITGAISLPPNPPAEHSWRQNDAGVLKTSDTGWDDPDHRSFRFLIKDNGAFRIPDVPAGSYELTLNLTAEPRADQCGTGHGIGKIQNLVIDVEENETKPQALGELKGEWFRQKDAGDFAENFVARTASEAITLDQYAGKLVLLDFWATWCRPCVAEMPMLQELNDRFKDDDDFSLIALSLDKDFDQALRMAERQKWDWTIASGGQWTSDLVPRAYDVKAIPVKFLIGRDGTILYRGTDLEQIETLIEEQLKLDSAVDVEEVSRSLRLRAQPVLDENFKGDGRRAAIVVAYSEPYHDPSMTEKPSFDEGLNLFDKQGELIRRIPNIALGGWLKRPDRLTADFDRGVIYAVSSNTLHAVELNGRRKFEVEIAGLQAVAVEPSSGNICCLCGTMLNTGCTIILHSNGDELKRLPLQGFSLRYSSADNGFWVIGKGAKLVTAGGEVVAEFALDDDSYTFSALAVDPAGGCWALEDSHPDVASSREQLWRITREGMTRVGKSEGVNLDTSAGTYLRSLAVKDNEVWVSIIQTKGLDDQQPVRMIRRYSKEGVLLGELPYSAEQLESDGRGGIWAANSEGISRLGDAGEVKAKIVRKVARPDKVYQSTWIVAEPN